MNDTFVFDLRHRYVLAPQIYTCCIDDHCVVFNLRTNDPQLLDLGEKRALEILMQEENPLQDVRLSDLMASITILVEKGILIGPPSDAARPGRQGGIAPVNEDMRSYPFDGMP